MPKKPKDDLSTALTYVQKAQGIIEGLQPAELRVAGGTKAAEEALESLKQLLNKAKGTLYNLMR